MAQKHVLKMQSVFNYFIDCKKLIERGENAMESGHVAKMQFDDSTKIIRGTIHASMKDKCYKVEIYLDNDYSINSSTCSCPRGQALCHHVAALAFFAHHNISVTDGSCSWSAPKKVKTVENVKTIDELFPPSKEYRATGRLVTDNEIEELRQSLDGFAGAVGFSWLLSADLQDDANFLVPAVTDILHSKDYQETSDKQALLEEKLMVNKNTIKMIAESTVGQSTNPKWLIYRKFRITASNFGVVLAACRRNKFPPSLYTRLAGSYTLDGIKSIQWGRDHEKDGIEAFCKTTGFTVRQTGLHLHPCGYLGATPDGLVGEDGIIEVKCPFKYRNVDIATALQTDKSYVCHYDCNLKEFQIKETHDYYHQIQGQLQILNKKVCYLVIWTPSTAVILNIKKNESWATNINLLKSFYKDHFIPYLLK